MVGVSPVMAVLACFRPAGGAGTMSCRMLFEGRGVVSAVWMRLRAELRIRWRAWLGLAGDSRPGHEDARNEARQYPVSHSFLIRMGAIASSQLNSPSIDSGNSFRCLWRAPAPASQIGGPPARAGIRAE